VAVEDPPELVYPPNKGIFEPQIQLQWPSQGNIVICTGFLFVGTVKNGRFRLFKASLYNIYIAIKAKDLKAKTLEEIVPDKYHEF